MISLKTSYIILTFQVFEVKRDLIMFVYLYILTPHLVNFVGS